MKHSGYINHTELLGDVLQGMFHVKHSLSL